MFGIFKRRDFDFCKYVLQSGYKEKGDYPLVRIFENGKLEITVYELKIVKGYNTVSIDFNSENMATLKFIPKSKRMTQKMLGQIMDEINESKEKIQ
jgi:hypothetical protein